MTPNLLKNLRAQPRLVGSVALGLLLFIALPGRASTRAVVAFDAATGLYLVLALAMMARSDVDRIRTRAASQDEGNVVILALTTLTALASLAGVMAELAKAKAAEGREGPAHVLLAAVTVLLSWGFLHTIFAVHYAHEYYAPDEDGTAGGLAFPGEDSPDYWDFAYQAFVLGTACATADVDITGRRIRRVAAMHGIVAFFFNTTILALMINIGAGFF